MKIEEACIGCIINQSVRVADAIHANAALKEELISSVETMSKSFSFAHTPPEIAADVYAHMARIAQKYDLYDRVKKLSTLKALSFLPLLKEKLSLSDDKLLTATKIAVAGNVIDLAAEVAFDLEEELEKIFHTAFAHDDFALLQTQLQNAKKIVLLGDNVGEHIFDFIFLQTLQEVYPNASYSYFVRGVPIINDVTMQEAKEAGFESICELVDSGVNTPGFTYARANGHAQELFDAADVVISKGMGNYECLTPSHKTNICFLLKVKCSVVASSLGKNIGDIICKMV